MSVKPYYKAILRHCVLPVCGYLIGLYLKFVFKTSRVHIEKHPDVDYFFNGLNPALYLFWHGRLLMMATIHPPQYQMRVLSSKNDVGIIADNCVRLFGITLIRGSKNNPNKPDRNKGGAEALKEMLRCLKNGFPIGVTPDGPLGPAHQINKGILVASILSKKPVIPMTYSCKSGYQAKSWDKFLVPFPFTELRFKLSRPIYPPEHRTPESIDAFALEIETILNKDMQELDILCKRNETFK
jgi:lysophospholipid acyltransferase (LPLAT)-like uncharacterized protein